jgi:hypothetical protein
MQAFSFFCDINVIVGAINAGPASYQQDKRFSIVF